MAMDNTVTVTGNITRDPELRFTAGGTAVTTFGLACNRRWQNRQTNETEEQVSFFDVTGGRPTAEPPAGSRGAGTR
ncbi:MAG: single-stranded DNA-binding protein, partial [bacterium]|nr:single-stranded DNA-binding protein [bacterium]